MGEAGSSIRQVAGRHVEHPLAHLWHAPGGPEEDAIRAPYERFKG